MSAAHPVQLCSNQRRQLSYPCQQSKVQTTGHNLPWRQRLVLSQAIYLFTYLQMQSRTEQIILLKHEQIILLKHEQIILLKQAHICAP